jgi:large subunit ribosomal protein L4
MTDCIVRDWQGKESGKVTLSLSVARQESAADLLHRAVVRQQAHARQGTASTLTRAEVAGGGRKPYKQKGTGRARQGSIRTPLRPGGGIVFGPKPRSYELGMNRKERRLALRTALISRSADITVVRGFGTDLEAPKTREITAALQRFGIGAEARVLLILEGASEAVKLSVRNLEKVRLIAADQLNVVDLLGAHKLIINEEAIAKIQEVYGDG